MKRALIFLSLSLVVSSSAALCATVSLYSNGNLVDPSPDTDLSNRWSGASLESSISLASGFSLPSESLLENVSIFTYDTLDGSAGILKQIGYSIFIGGSIPSGTPIASGIGSISSSMVLSGHSSLDGVGSDGQLHEGLQTIATSFNLASPVDLQGGINYWLVLSAVTDPSGVSANAKWADSDQIGGFYLVDGIRFDGGRAFELGGEIVSVPDRASTGLLLLGSLLGLTATHFSLARLGRKACC